MKRSLMQAYVKGSDKAVELYLKAFDAILVASFPNSDGTFLHAEIDICGQTLAIAEFDGNDVIITGNVMQFCLHFGEGKEEIVIKAFSVLKDGARIIHSLSSCGYSPLMCDLIDKFGIRWCLFV